MDTVEKCIGQVRITYGDNFLDGTEYTAMFGLSQLSLAFRPMFRLSG